MNRINSILVVTPNYPIEGEPVYPFVKNLCVEFANRGISVIVLSPQSITSAIFHKRKLRPKVWTEVVSGNEIIVYQPYSFTLSYKYLKTYNNIVRFVVTCFLRKNKIKVDVCYCHFWCSAYWVMPFMKSHSIPIIVASGESQISALLSTKCNCLDFQKNVSGVVCVSSKNRQESISLGYTIDSKCIVIPNAVNTHLFHKLDKTSIRSKLGLSEEDFVVAFVGWFIERKGPLRVAEAINHIGGIKSIFIGKGEQNPICEGIIFKGQINFQKQIKWKSH